MFAGAGLMWARAEGCHAAARPQSPRPEPAFIRLRSPARKHFIPALSPPTLNRLAAANSRASSLDVHGPVMPPARPGSGRA